MRINKYRGRRSYDKKWIYGSLLIDNNGDFHILESNIIEKDGHHIHIDSDSPMFFDNDTIGQFTGLCDKNGVKIFEGDIVKICEPFTIPQIAKVTFNDGCYDVVGITLTFRDYLKCFVANHAIEVIGNIHERSD